MNATWRDGTDFAPLQSTLLFSERKPEIEPASAEEASHLYGRSAAGCYCTAVYALRLGARLRARLQGP